MSSMLYSVEGDQESKIGQGLQPKKNLLVFAFIMYLADYVSCAL
jgi:hypothetical protein